MAHTPSPDLSSIRGRYAKARELFRCLVYFFWMCLFFTAQYQVLKVYPFYPQIDESLPIYRWAQTFSDLSKLSYLSYVVYQFEKIIGLKIYNPIFKKGQQTDFKDIIITIIWVVFLKTLINRVVLIIKQL